MRDLLVGGGERDGGRSPGLKPRQKEYKRIERERAGGNVKTGYI